IDIAIIGAGPYGLSLAAHLREYGVHFRIFGQPMQFWCDIAGCSPERYLKSFCFGVNIYTPRDDLSFVSYSKVRGLETLDACTIRDFANYGLWVQKQTVPEVDHRFAVTEVSRIADGFRLTLSNREIVDAKRVVVATGLTYFASLPSVFAGLPGELVKHTSNISNYAPYRNRDVCVIGGGHTAFYATARVSEAGARLLLL